MANFLVRLCTSAVAALEVKAPKPQQPWHIPRRQIRPPPPGGCDYALSINKGGVCGMVVGTNDMGSSSAKAWAWAGAVCPPCWWRAVRMRESGDRGRSRTFGEEFATFSRGSSKHGALTRSLRFSPICRLAVSGLLDCASRHYWRVASLVRGHPDLVMWRTLLQHGVPTPKLGAHTNI